MNTIHTHRTAIVTADTAVIVQTSREIGVAHPFQTLCEVINQRILAKVDTPTKVTKREQHLPSEE
jgi:hypothetical protein